MSDRADADDAAIGAAVDVGSTSVHCLVAEVGPSGLRPIFDESELLGLGDVIDAEQRLPEGPRQELVAVLRRYAAAAARSGARATTFVATEPLRRTPDAARVCAEVEREIGLPLHVLRHDEEAYLTLIGVAGGRRFDRAVLIVDVGGGSSEIVRAEPDRDPIATGLRLGAGRLTAAHVTHDPPTATEVEAMRAAAAGVLADAPDDRPGAVVAVGGTASNVLRVLGRDEADDVVSRADLRVALDRLLGQTTAEAVDRHGVRPTRARILVAGAVILDAILDRYGVDRLRVSQAGIREGTVLAVAKAGIGWRDRLRRLAGGRD